MISICLLTKGENKYLKEWIEHHLKIGIGHFYIYDNNEDLSVKNEVLKYFDAKYFTIIPWHFYCSNMQVEAYNDCLRHFGKDNEWIAFIDTDEFINCENIQNSLVKYKQYDSVKMPWVMYNANGHLHYSAEPIRERFTRQVECLEKNENSRVKSFIQPSMVKKMNVHIAETTSGNNILIDDIVVDHYYTRSLEEWIEKMNRGTCAPTWARKYEEFFAYNPDLIEHKDKYLLNLSQKYFDCIKSFDIRIIARPSRRNNVLKLLSQLNLNEDIIIYSNENEDAFDVIRRAWLSPMSPNVTHRLVLQDDIIICDNFINIVNDIINTVPDKTLSLFNMVPSSFVRDRKCNYRQCDCLLNQAIVIPKTIVLNYLDWTDKHYNDTSHNILSLTTYCRRAGIDMYTTIPSLVQYVGDEADGFLSQNNSMILKPSPTYIQHPMDDFKNFIPEKTKTQ